MPDTPTSSARPWTAQKQWGEISRRAPAIGGGVQRHFATRLSHAGHTVRTVLPPVVSGAVVMLIGFNLAPVVAGVYWPQDPGVAMLVMIFIIVAAVAFRGSWCRIAIFLALIFGFQLSWVLDVIVGEITAPTGHVKAVPEVTAMTSSRTWAARCSPTASAPRCSRPSA